MPASERIYLLGDFNARVGASQESWPNIPGHHSIENMDENGQRLLELCRYHNLCVTNTYFQNKTWHKAFWRHPRSNHWHQLDLVIARCDSLNSVCNTTVYYSDDRDPDHSMVVAKVKNFNVLLKLKCQPTIDISKTAYPVRNREFIERLEETLTSDLTQSSEDKWKSLRNTIYNAVVMTYSKKKRKNVGTTWLWWIFHSLTLLWQFLASKMSN